LDEALTPLTYTRRTQIGQEPGEGIQRLITFGYSEDRTEGLRASQWRREATR